MAKKRLKLKDKQGNVIDYDISAASVTIDAEGRSVEVKLAELVAAIAETVTSVTFNGEPHSIYNRRIDLGNQMQPDWEESSPTYPSYVRNKPNVVTGIKVGEGGSTLTPNNGVVTLPESEGGYAPPAGGIPKTDLAADVQNSLGKADTALQSFTETDPTVPSWAKQPTKPTYTAQEVGALPANTDIPSKTSDLNNDSGFVTESDVEDMIDEAVDGLGGEVSVTTNEDGTFVIHVGETDYTIDLNHEHPQYAGYKTIESTTDAAVTLSRDVIYDLGTVAGNKTISLPSTVDGAADYEFRLTYTSGTITLPSGVLVANDGTLAFTAGKIYQVVISGGILYYSETSASA